MRTSPAKINNKSYLKNFVKVQNFYKVEMISFDHQDF
jgi:hypothetical protein